MKNLLKFTFVVLGILNSANLFSQNVLINVLTRNSGIAKKGKIIFFEIAINNTSPTKSISAYKLKPQISFPTALVDVPKTGHVLPKGWEIISNSNGVLLLTNGSDVILENESRIILIAIRGKSKGGPATITGNLNFSNGIAPGSAAGVAPQGDNFADNTSTSTIRVIK